MYRPRTTGHPSKGRGVVGRDCAPSIGVWPYFVDTALRGRLLHSPPKDDLEISRSVILPHLSVLEPTSNANVLASTPVPVRPSHGRNLGHVMPVLGVFLAAGSVQDGSELRHTLAGNIYPRFFVIY